MSTERSRGAVIGVAAWCAVVVVAMVWPLLAELPERSGVHAPPFYGRWSLHDVAGLVPAVVLAVVLVVVWPKVTDRAPMWALAIGAGAASCAWALALAVSGGIDRLSSPLAGKHGYLSIVESVEPGRFTREFVDQVERYSIHVKGHPPGVPLLFWWLDRIGLGGAERATVVTLVVWGLGIAAVIWAVREVAGADTARRASGAIAFVPGVVWVATTADALFAGLMAMAISLLVVASGRRDARGDAAAVAGGALAAFCLHLSYGLVPLGLIPVAVIVLRRRVRPVVAGGVGFALVTGLFVRAGFWWFDGLEATRGFYAIGISRFRPYPYFTFAGNPAALAIGVGPAAAAGFGIAAASVARWRSGVRSVPWGVVVPLAALVAVAAADLSGLSKAEVERIWIPFMPWIAAAAALAMRRADERRWLGATLAVGLVVQATLVTPW